MFLQQLSGIKAGDPLSLFLLIIVMEVLNCMLSQAINAGFMSGFSVGSTTISHLLFAYDTLLFCDPASSHQQYLRAVLPGFEVVSSLKDNLTKLELVPVSAMNHIQNLASIMGCKVATLPMKYLNMPLGAPFKSRTVWEGVLENIDRKLEGWKHSYLLKGGR